MWVANRKLFFFNFILYLLKWLYTIILITKLPLFPLTVSLLGQNPVDNEERGGPGHRVRRECDL